LPITAFNAPKAPKASSIVKGNIKGGFKTIINPSVTSAGLVSSPTTDSRAVTLQFNAGSDVKRMALSNTPDFKNAIQEKYEPTTTWDLCSQTGGFIKSPTCEEGIHTVYVKFYTRWGQPSEVVSQDIFYGTPPSIDRDEGDSSDISNGESGTESVQGPGDPLITSVSLPSSFNRNLGYGDVGSDVKALQEYLNKKGFIIAETGLGSPGNETDEFGSRTKAALARFQEAFRTDILDPLNLTAGTGFLGSYTRGYIRITLESEEVQEAFQEVPDELLVEAVDESAEAEEEVPDELLVEAVDESAEAEEEINIFDEGATHTCKIIPFSKKINRGASDRRLIKLDSGEKVLPFDLKTGNLPDGLSIALDAVNGQGQGDVGLSLSATDDANQGSFNIVVIYKVTEDNGRVVSNFCQLNVIVE